MRFKEIEKITSTDLKTVDVYTFAAIPARFKERWNNIVKKSELKIIYKQMLKINNLLSSDKNLSGVLDKLESDFKDQPRVILAVIEDVPRMVGVSPANGMFLAIPEK